MQIEREALKKAIEAVKPAVASSGSVPELKHVWWDGQSISGYNGALGIKVPWTWDLPAGGVLASALLGVLGSSSAEKVDLAVTDDKLTVKAGKSTVKLDILEGKANPWPPAFKPNAKNAQCTVELTAELMTGLKGVRVIKASNPTRVEHYGVVLFPDKEFLALYTTDSRMMAEVRVDGEFDQELERLVLPFAFVQQLLDMKAGSRVYFRGDAIVATEEDGGVVVCSNTMDTSDVWDLPKLVDDLAKDLETAITLPDGWGEALNRAEALAGGGAESYLKMVASSKSKEVVLTGRLQYGSLEERFSFPGKVPAGQITVELGALRALTKDAASFTIGERALVVNGKSEELYLIAKHEEDDAKKEARREAPKRSEPAPAPRRGKRADMDDEIPF